MNIIQKTINEINVMSAEMIANAKSGHTGMSLGASTIMYALFKDHYIYDIRDNQFFSRDRLVLSAGHCSSLFYSCAYLFGMGLNDSDLKHYRRLGSKTPGHPDIQTTPFVECSTGPLGQGIANAVGMAIGQTMLAERFNVQKAPIIDNWTYCLCGDGCLMEGVAQEAISLAGNLKLNKLILLYDCNQITIDGKLNLANTENQIRKFKSMNWNVIVVNNGHSYRSVTNAIAQAKKSKNKPTVVIFKTIIGYGCAQEGQSSIHGKWLSNDELNGMKEKLEVKTESFKFSDDVKSFAERTIRKQRIELEKWNRMFVLYSTTHPELYRQLNVFMENRKVDFNKILKPEIEKQDMSGRDANALILKELSAKMPRLVGGTADVAPSTRVYIPSVGDYLWNNRRGKNIHFGVREHSMGAICNGLALYLKNPIFCSSYTCFSNYMLPSIRMSALMNLPVLYMFTHDSYKVGADGATHQPIEQLSMLRLIPNLNVFRPCDTSELIGCYQSALANSCPSVFLLSKQQLPYCGGIQKMVQKGGYLLSGEKGDVVIFATGSEVSLALEIKSILENENVKVVVASFPCLELFEKQTQSYKTGVLNSGDLRVSLEASNDNVWYKYLRENDLHISVEVYGMSGTVQELDKHFGFNANIIAKKIKNNIKKNN